MCANMRLPVCSNEKNIQKLELDEKPSRHHTN